MMMSVCVVMMCEVLKERLKDQPKKDLDGNVEFKFKRYEKSVTEVGGA